MKNSYYQILEEHKRKYEYDKIAEKQKLEEIEELKSDLKVLREKYGADLTDAYCSVRKGC